LSHPVCSFFKSHICLDFGIVDFCVSRGAQYVTVLNEFLHPSLVIDVFATPIIKLKRGQQIGGKLLIANHLAQSLWRANHKHWEEIGNIYYTLFCSYTEMLCLLLATATCARLMLCQRCTCGWKDINTKSCIGGMWAKSKSVQVGPIIV
jgi:hypothetical protein